MRISNTYIFDSLEFVKFIKKLFKYRTQTTTTSKIEINNLITRLNNLHIPNLEKKWLLEEMEELKEQTTHDE